MSEKTKEILRLVINIVVAALTALGTTLGINA